MDAADSSKSKSQDENPEAANSGMSEATHEPSELQLTHDDFRDIGRRIEADMSGQIDFNDFSLKTHVVIDSIGDPEMEDFGIPTQDLLKEAYDPSEPDDGTENINKSPKETVAPLEEPLDFDNVMKMFEVGDDEDSRSTIVSYKSKTKSKSSVTKEKDEETSSKSKKSELASELYDPSDLEALSTNSSSVSTTTTKVTTSAKFTGTLGYAPYLSTTWTGKKKNYYYNYCYQQKSKIE